jgi:PAT family beta-lactamase induction signal transducer AmpG
MPDRLESAAPARALAATAVLGFASGLPLLLTTTTLQAWLTTAGVDLGTVGLFALVGLPYTLKFLWSPLLDRFALPLLPRRRGWILAAQGLLVALILALALVQPREGLALVAGLVLALAFASATQDIAIDAWRAEILPPRWQGLGASLTVGFYRLGMVAAGAGALVAADRFGWRWTFLALAALMLPCLLANLAAPQPELPPAPATLADAVVRPLKALLARRGAGEALLFVVLYKLGDSLGLALVVPFLLKTGFSMTEVGLATKGIGVAALVAGGLLGGLLMAWWPLRRALLVFGLVQLSTCLVLMVLALSGRSLPWMLTAITFENLGYGLGTAAYTAFMMRLCDRGLAATQYALVSSLMALTRVVFASPAGKAAEHLGWPAFFGMCALLAVPGLLMLLRYGRWELPDGSSGG